ncbi:MAG: multicopper oxidase domain-containing protein [Gemmatimonadaceae bacterium]|nr:multicopper oxidase domain-containing protein [Gemmatimonadaceae bacterium]
MPSPIATIIAALIALSPPPAHAPQQLVANNNRTAAGAVVNGEYRVALDIVETDSTSDADRVTRARGPAFAERGKAAQLPGPLLRTRVGVSVHLTLRNSLTRAVAISGLSDRSDGARREDRPAFFDDSAVVLQPGEERELRFTPTHAVNSFYFARVVDPTRGGAPLPQGSMVGAFIVDAADAVIDPDERIFVLTIGADLGLNGLSWPHTERLHYAEGTRVRWRVINASNEWHPMHLHGFYFKVHRRGDAQRDTTVAEPRALQVTEGMLPFSSMELTWNAERPGNWLFHCHLIIHSQGPLPDSAARATAMAMDHNMAGLILGVTITPRTTVAHAARPAARQIDLWTGTRAGVFGDAVGHAFLVQRGPVPPAPDSMVMLSDRLLLTRGERTRIVVHNRLAIPLSVHWHGMELESTDDGVGHWSGSMAHPRPPIAPGDSTAVYLTPPRAGSFMYHVHGEPDAELQQGLYGALLVTEPGQPLDPRRDRTILLASRGATPDAGAAINGRARPHFERFEPGQRYRLRLLHVSTNDVKHVRLLRDGAPTEWRPLARDGATLPSAQQLLRAASLRMDVGQTADFEWTPTLPGVYTLEVTTESVIIPRGVQRVAFGVGAVSDDTLRVAMHGTALPLAENDPADPGLMGGYQATTAAGATAMLSVWREGSNLFMSQTRDGLESAPSFLLPLADGRFAPGTIANGLMKEAQASVHYRLQRDAITVDSADAHTVIPRATAVTVDSAALAAFTGRYEQGFEVRFEQAALTLLAPNTPPLPLRAISPSRFLFDLGGLTALEFVRAGGRVTHLRIRNFSIEAARVEAR